MDKLINFLTKPLFDKLVQFLNKRFKNNRFRKDLIISNPRINYNINSLLNRYGTRVKIVELDREKVYKYEQKSNNKFVVIKRVDTIDNYSILAVVFNDELVYLTGDYIHQVYKPGIWEQKLEILANR
jgi:hypothetical protein